MTRVVLAVVALALLSLPGLVASAQVIYAPPGEEASVEGPLVSVAAPADLSLKQRYAAGSCAPRQPAGVIKVVRAPRPYAPGVSYVRPELFVDYPACNEVNYYRKADDLAAPAQAPAATQPAARSVPDEEWVYRKTDDVTLTRPGMVLPSHLRNPAKKGQVVVRPFAPRKLNPETRRMA